MMTFKEYINEVKKNPITNVKDAQYIVIKENHIVGYKNKNLLIDEIKNNEIDGDRIFIDWEENQKESLKNEIINNINALKNNFDCFIADVYDSDPEDRDILRTGEVLFIKFNYDEIKHIN